MIWLIELIVLIVGISVVAVLMSKSGRASTASRIEQRVKAYLETIRRTSQPQALNAMSDVELVDVLHTASNRLLRHQANRSILLAVTAATSLIIGVFLGANYGIQSFALTLAIGAITGYGIDRIMSKFQQEWLARQELDVDRLTLD